MQRPRIVMNLIDAANLAHKQINIVIPQTQIEYMGKTYRGYMNSRDVALSRDDGGYNNSRDRIIHIQTQDVFSVGGIVTSDEGRFKITACTSNPLYRILTMTFDLYD